MTIYNKVDSMAYIYKITSPSNRVYIGSTNNIGTRKRNYKSLSCKQQRKLYNSLLKYGWDNHSFEVIEEVLFEHMYIRERHWQEVYDVVSEGLNCLLVDTLEKPRVVSKETRLLMSKNSGARNKSRKWIDKINESNRGSKHTEESKLKMSMTKLGKKESKETREKKRQMRLGKKHSPETIKKIKEGQKGKKVFSKKLYQYSLEGEFIREWKNCKEASENLQVSISYLRDAARGVYNHKAHGFSWKYDN